jgi:polyribonucleotide nucleotidyltransferase
VTRLADFGAFVEIIPGTDGLLHISEVAEHRIADVRDELKEGDQVLVKVLAVEGNRIRLSRKAILKEQRAKMTPSGGDGAAAQAVDTEDEAVPTPALTGTMVIEGGGDFPDEPDSEPNFNREGGPHVGSSDRPPQGDRPHGGDRGGRGGRPGGGGGRDRGRGGRSGRPGGGGGRDRGGRGGPGGGRH